MVPILLSYDDVSAVFRSRGNRPRVVGEFMGMQVAVDPKMPNGVVELRDSETGEVLGSISVAEPQPLSRKIGDWPWPESE